jgi:endonuclease YncB( thermonuclease family)
MPRYRLPATLVALAFAALAAGCQRAPEPPPAPPASTAAPTASFNQAARPEVRVHDGDTLRLEGVAIRLWGIDSVELSQRCRDGNVEVTCGIEAREALRAMVKDKHVSCERVATDRYQRQVSKCKADELEINAEMVRQGWALDDGRYSKGYYAAIQRESKEAKRGLWRYAFQKPWDWRKAKREAQQQARPS